jgi:hypothetical protein
MKGEIFKQDNINNLMKKGWIIGIIILILVAMIFLVPFLNKDMRMGKACIRNLDLGTPPTMALAHGIEFPCYYVFSQAFDENNSKICKYLKEDEFAEAMCLGSSAKTWEDKELCSSLSLDVNKQICILNVVNKLERINSLENLKGTDICEDISSDDLRPICLGYKSVINSNYSFCIENNIIDKNCAAYFLIYNKDPLAVKNICEELFTSLNDLFSCYTYSPIIAYNLTLLPDTIFFKKSPSWNYICKTNISTLSEINDSCLPIDYNYKVFPSYHSMESWTYG